MRVRLESRWGGTEVAPDARLARDTAGRRPPLSPTEALTGSTSRAADDPTFRVRLADASDVVRLSQAEQPPEFVETALPAWRARRMTRVWLCAHSTRDGVAVAELGGQLVGWLFFVHARSGVRLSMRSGLNFLRLLAGVSRTYLGLSPRLWVEYLRGGLHRPSWSLAVQGSPSQDLSAGTALIQDVFVLPEFRRRGIASALLRATAEVLQQRGYRQALLWVPTGNTGAQELYTRDGYVRRCTVEWMGEPHWVMAKSLCGWDTVVCGPLASEGHAQTGATGYRRARSQRSAAPPSAPVRLRRLQISWEEWDERVAGFEQRRLFHGAAWLQVLEDIRRGEAVMLEVLAGGSAIGLWPGLQARMGPFNVLGSPLPGTHTFWMGPLLHEPAPAEELGEAVVAYARDSGIHHIELCSDSLQGEELRAQGWHPDRVETLAVDLRGSEADLWAALGKKCRNSIRRAQKLGVTVACLPTEPAAAGRVYCMLETTFGRQGLKPSVSRSDVETVCRSLQPTEQAQVWLARGPDGLDVAGAVVLVDHQRLYYWIAGSRPEGYDLSAQNLLLWEVLRSGQAQGLCEADLYGPGPPGVQRFKLSFGAQPVTYRQWSRSLTPAARAARTVYKWWRSRGASGFAADLQRR